MDRPSGGKNTTAQLRNLLPGRLAGGGTCMLKLRTVGFVSCFVLAVTFSFGAVAQQLKLGYIDMARIQQTYKGFKDAEAQFQKAAKDLQDKIRVNQEALEQQKQQYESRKMMLTEQRRQDDEKQIAQKEQELMKQVQDSQGVLAQQESDLTRPLQEKIFTVVQVIAKAENYTYIFDASVLIYVDPQKGVDLTNQVLEELGKEVK